MAQTSPYSFSGFTDHLYFGYREIMTFSVFKPEKPLEEKQEVITRMGELYPDKIPVVIEEECDTTKQQISLVVEANSSIGDLFTTVVKQIYQLEDFISVRHWDPTAGKLMSSIYDEHKDEDGCLYMTLNGYFRRLPKLKKKKKISKDLDAVLAEKKRKYIDLAVEIQSMEEKLQKMRRKVTENEGAQAS